MDAERRLAHATTDSERIRLQAKLDETERAFYTTVKGQHALERAILERVDLAKTDSAVAEELTRYRLMLRDAKNTFEAQMAAYKATERDSTLKTLLSTSNKQLLATGITLYKLLQHFPSNAEYHIINPHTISISNLHERYYMHCIPTKQTLHVGNVSPNHQEFPEDIAQLLIMSETSNHPELKEWMDDHFLDSFVRYYAHVDTRTEKLRITSSVHDSHDFLFKRKTRHGGTTNYVHGDTEQLRTELATLERVTNAKILLHESRTYLYDMPPLTRTEQHLPSFYLAPVNEHYEVRRKHASSNYDIMLQLTAQIPTIMQDDLSLLENKHV